MAVSTDALSSLTLHQDTPDLDQYTTTNSPDRNGSCTQALSSFWFYHTIRKYNFTLDMDCRTYLIQAQMVNYKAVTAMEGKSTRSGIFKIWGSIVVTAMCEYTPVICWCKGKGIPNVPPKEELLHAPFNFNMSVGHTEVKNTYNTYFTCKQRI